jgi:transketolase
MSQTAIRDAFGEALLEAGHAYKNVVVLSCDLKGATKTKAFFDAFPQRSFEVGIAEANGLGISAGLALAGLRPFISSFGSFITGKNVEIRTSIAYNDAPVVIVGTHGGLIGPDGTTQAGLQDITTMRAMPRFKIFQPASGKEAKAIVDHVARTRDLVYLRIARNKVPEIYDDHYRFMEGKGYILREGSDLTVIASGPVLHPALEAAQQCGARFSVQVVNMPSLKPIDRGLIIASAEHTRAVMTIEDHSIEGGLGSMVCEVIAEEALGVPVLRHGIQDIFTESGTPEELEEKYQLDAKGILWKIEQFMQTIRRKNPSEIPSAS